MEDPCATCAVIAGRAAPPAAQRHRQNTATRKTVPRATEQIPMPTSSFRLMAVAADWFFVPKPALITHFHTL